MPPDSDKGPANQPDGVPSPADFTAMTGRELLQAVAEGRLPQPPIAKVLSFRLVEVGDGTVVFEGEPGPHLLNPLSTIHGGWALTLIDSAAACAGHTTLPAGTMYTTVETKVNFVRAIRPDTGTVRATGRVISAGRQVILADANVTDSAGRVLAHGTSTLLVLKPRA